MPKKPDRFERMILKRIYVLNKRRRTKGFRCNGCMEYPEVAKLLRNEHEWMRGMVKKLDAWACQELAEHDDVISAILKALDQRRK